MNSEAKNRHWTVLWGNAGACWGLLGVLMLLSSAIFRLSGHVVDAFEYGLKWQHWLVLIPWTAFMVIGEGFRGFQKGFSPRVASRLLWLKSHPAPLRVLLAPAFGIGFFHARRKRIITSALVLAAIVGVVFAVSHLPQPWRGVIDVGVVSGLAWGWGSTLWMTVKAILTGVSPADPELPEPVAS